MGETAQVLRLLLRRWPILLVGVALGVGGAILASDLMPPSYSSSSYVLVVPARETDGGNAINYAQAYARIATNQAVVQKALIDNGIAVEPGRIRQLVSASASPDAPLIEITARDRQPERAAARGRARPGNRRLRPQVGARLSCAGIVKTRWKDGAWKS